MNLPGRVRLTVSGGRSIFRREMLEPGGGDPRREITNGGLASSNVAHLASKIQNYADFLHNIISPEICIFSNFPHYIRSATHTPGHCVLLYRNKEVTTGDVLHTAAGTGEHSGRWVVTEVVMRENFDMSAMSTALDGSRGDVNLSLSKTRLLPKEAHSYVGFANFPNQVFRRAIKNGFEFTLMVVGQSGLGKSTFINSLFATELSDGQERGAEPYSRTTQIEERVVRLVENGVLLNLTLVDCPGFGDAVDNNKCWEPIVQFVERKYLEFFAEETKIERSEIIADKRVHLCLYFIAPSGHGLKALDIEFMKKLHERVNIIPVIAKADSLTADELARFKQQVLKEIDESGVRLYKFPDMEDDDEKRQFGHLKERVPFAVVGSNQTKDIDGRQVRCREYPWGVVEVENLNHNDFIALRDMIIRTNLIDLIAVTRNVHYENFRFRQMSKGARDSPDGDPFTQMERERRTKEKELQTKKLEMEKVFEEKVSEREKRLTAKQNEVEDRERENKRILQERRQALDQLMSELVDLRRMGAISRQDSRASSYGSENSSPPDKVKRRTLGLFKSN